MRIMLSAIDCCRTVSCATILLALLVPSAAEGASTTALPEAKLASLLTRRLEGSLGHTLSQFANMFLVRSQMDLPCAVALSAKTDEIAGTELMPVFPENYRPTLKELLDAIALQTHSKWSYVTECTGLRTSAEGPVDGVACFEFAPAESGLRFRIKLPEGWSVRDGGNRLMCAPATFPVGLDIYEMGTYSPDPGSGQDMSTIRDAVALQWAGRAKEGATRAEMKELTVAGRSALFFATRVPSRLGGEVTWRQWVFVSGRRCYFVISTLDDEHDAKVMPQIEGILESFTEAKESGEPLRPSPTPSV